MPDLPQTLRKQMAGLFNCINRHIIINYFCPTSLTFWQGNPQQLEPYDFIRMGEQKFYFLSSLGAIYSVGISGADPHYNYDQSIVYQNTRLEALSAEDYFKLDYNQIKTLRQECFGPYTDLQFKLGNLPLIIKPQEEQSQSKRPITLVKEKTISAVVQGIDLKAIGNIIKLEKDKKYLFMLDAHIASGEQMCYLAESLKKLNIEGVLFAVEDKDGIRVIELPEGPL